MNTTYIVAKSDINTGSFGTHTFVYESLEEFMNQFPYSERPCIIQAERALNRNGFFIFSDSKDRIRYRLFTAKGAEGAKQ